MNHRGDLLGQALLQGALTGVGSLLGNECFHLFAAQGGENLDVFFGVGVADVQPELIELIGRRVAAVEPDVAALGLAEFAAVGLGDQRAGQGKRLAPFGAANELGAGGDVAPLVRAAELQAAVFVAIEIEIIVALKELIGELGEAHALLRFAAQALFHGVLGHHVVDGDVLADVADEVQEAIVLHPVVVVDKLGGIGRVRVEVKELG